MGEFHINVKRNDAGLGIDTRHAPDGTSLLITSILSRGSVKEWNASHDELAIRRGDRIVEVNGIRGHWQLLSDKTKASDNLKIAISRCPTYSFNRPECSKHAALADTADTVDRE